MSLILFLFALLLINTVFSQQVTVGLLNDDKYKFENIYAKVLLDEISTL